MGLREGKPLPYGLDGVEKHRRCGMGLRHGIAGRRVSKEKKPRWGFFSKRSARRKKRPKQSVIATQRAYATALGQPVPTENRHRRCGIGLREGKPLPYGNKKQRSIAEFMPACDTKQKPPEARRTASGGLTAYSGVRRSQPRGATKQEKKHPGGAFFGRTVLTTLGRNRRGRGASAGIG